MANTSSIITEPIADAVDRGSFLGCTIDSWIFYSVNLISVPLSAVLIYLRVLQTTRGKEESADSDGSDESGALISSPSRPGGGANCYQRMLSRISTHEAAVYNFDLALRASLASVFCALTYWEPLLGWWQRQGWSMQYVVVMLAFSMYQDLGTTVNLVWTGYYGTLLSVLNAIFIYAVFPSGTSDGNPSAWWFGVINFVLFTVALVALRFNNNAKMFALSWQAYFTLCFLNPRDSTAFNTSLYTLTLTCADTSAMMGTIWGCIAALLCVMVPTCLSALGQAQDLVLEDAWAQGNTVRRMLERCLSSSGALEVESLELEVGRLRRRQASLDQLLSNGWWECFGAGPTGVMRERLRLLSGTSEHLNDQLHAVAALTRLQRVQGIGSADTLMQQAVARVSVACEMDISPEDQEELQQLLKSHEDAQQALATAFVAARKQKLGGDCVTAESANGQALSFVLSTWSQTVAERAEGLLREDEDGRPLADGPLRTTVQGARHLLLLGEGCSRAYVAQTVHVCATFFATFLLGFLGIQRNGNWVIAQYSSTPPGTVAYLIFQGGNEAAALKKNSDRVLGVSMGAMTGQLMFVLLCNAFAATHGSRLVTAGGTLVFFFIELLSFFVYFNSVAFSYVGLLVACFFAEHVLQSCDGKGAEIVSTYSNLVGQFAAIVIATVSDVLNDPSQAAKAAKLLYDFAGTFQEDLRAPAASLPRAEGGDLLQEASTAASSAALEPRAVLPPWREKLWQRVHGAASELWWLRLMLMKAARVAPPAALKEPTLRVELNSLALRTERALGYVKDLLQQDLRYGEGRVLDSQYPVELTEVLALPKDPLEEIRLDNVAVPRALAEDGCCATAAGARVLKALRVIVRQLESSILDESDVRERVLQ